MREAMGGGEGGISATTGNNPKRSADNTELMNIDEIVAEVAGYRKEEREFHLEVY